MPRWSRWPRRRVLFAAIAVVAFGVEGQSPHRRVGKSNQPAARDGHWWTGSPGQRSPTGGTFLEQPVVRLMLEVGESAPAHRTIKEGFVGMKTRIKLVTAYGRYLLTSVAAVAFGVSAQ